MATHHKALRDYFILEKIEAGIELRGPEVKSIRGNRFSLNEAYATIDNGQIILHQLHINPYEHARMEVCNPTRPRRLLLHRQEISRLLGQTSRRGFALIPLKLYFKKGFAKIELALARGKQDEDKRETLRRKTAEREAERAIAARTRR